MFRELCLCSKEEWTSSLHALDGATAQLIRMNWFFHLDLPAKRSLCSYHSGLFAAEIASPVRRVDVEFLDVLSVLPSQDSHSSVRLTPMTFFNIKSDRKYLHIN